MPHQMDSKNCCRGRHSFRGFGRNLFNRMMNRFPRKWFIVIIGDVYHLIWKEFSHLYFSAVEQIPLYYKKQQYKTMWFCKMFFLLLMLLNNLKKIWSENNLYRFYDKAVTTAEEHNIDLPELPCYLRLQIKNGS